MKISIITAGFRDYLMDNVWESIKKQTYSNWEWILVNDGQEGVRQWYKESRENNKFEGYDVWMVDIERCRGRFGLYARNVGIMVAQNRLCFHDDDNEWRPNHLESLVQLEEKTGKYPYCWMRIIGKKPDSPVNHIKKTGFAKQGIDLGCLLYKKEWFETYGYFRNDRQVTFDWEAIKRIIDGIGKENFVCTEQDSLLFHHKRY